MTTIAKRIGVSVLMHASQKGGSGIYLYMPKEYAETFGIKSGMRVEVRLVKTFEDFPDTKKSVLILQKEPSKTEREWSKGHKRKREDEES